MGLFQKLFITAGEVIQQTWGILPSTIMAVHVAIEGQTDSGFWLDRKLYSPPPPATHGLVLPWLHLPPATQTITSQSGAFVL